MSQDAMCDAVNEAVRVNKIDDGYIRLVVTRGAGTLGLDPNRCSNPQVIIIADAISLYPQELYEKGLEIVTVSVQRNHPAALNPRIKSLNYLNNILAKIEGLQAGCIEALMLNHKGEVAECTGDNIFLVRGGVLLHAAARRRHSGRHHARRRDRAGPRSRHRSPRNAAHQARRLHRRRVLPHRHGGRSDPGRESRQPHHRHRQAGPDDARSGEAVQEADAGIDAIDCAFGRCFVTVVGRVRSQKFFVRHFAIAGQRRADVVDALDVVLRQPPGEIVLGPQRLFVAGARQLDLERNHLVARRAPR